jgi:hypothetical protein
VISMLQFAMLCRYMRCALLRLGTFLHFIRKCAARGGQMFMFDFATSVTICNASDSGLSATTIVYNNYDTLAGNLRDANSYEGRVR